LILVVGQRLSERIEVLTVAMHKKVVKGQAA